MADKVAFIGKSGLLLKLVAATICYQVLYHVFIWRTYRQDFLAASGDACALGIQGPQCDEAQLFRRWQRAELERPWPDLPDDAAQNQLLLSRHRTTMPLETAETQGFAKEAADQLAQQIEFDRLFNATAAALHSEDASSSWAHDLEALQMKFQQRMETLHAMHGNLSTAGHSGPDPSEQKEKQQQQTREVFDRLYQKTAAAVNRSNMTAWADGLEALQASLQSRMDRLRFQHEKLHAKAEPTPQKPPLLDRIAALGYELCQDPKRRLSPTCVEFLQEHPQAHKAQRDVWRAERAEHHANTTAQAKQQEQAMTQRAKELSQGMRDWDANVAAEVARANRELCADPIRADSEPCKRLLGADGETSRNSATDAKPTSSYGKLRGSVDHVGFSKESPEGYLQRMQWRSVKSWSDSRRLRGAAVQPLSAGREQLRFARWQGAIPSVACITALQAGPRLDERVRSFVDNFRKQRYEGLFQLIIVYPHDDAEAAKVLQRYADGAIIKGVAAQTQEFPSTAAFRYGMWSSDAEVIARWDFEDRHYPERLSWQVRAMALMSRPASLLPVSEQEASERAGAASWFEPASLVGERAWMWKHWHPLLGQEHDVLLGREQAHNIVRVEAPELLHRGRYTGSSAQADAASVSIGVEGAISVAAVGVDSHSTWNAASTQAIVSPSSSSNAVAASADEGIASATDGTTSNSSSSFGHERNRSMAVDHAGSICETFASNSSKPQPIEANNESDLELARTVADVVGAELGQAFRTLSARRREVDLHLRELCTEAKSVGEPSRVSMLLSQADEVASLKSQLDEHFRLVERMFKAAAETTASFEGYMSKQFAEAQLAPTPAPAGGAASIAA